MNLGSEGYLDLHELIRAEVAQISRQNNRDLGLGLIEKDTEVQCRHLQNQIDQKLMQIHSLLSTYQDLVTVSRNTQLAFLRCDPSKNIEEMLLYLTRLTP